MKENTHLSCSLAVSDAMLTLLIESTVDSASSSRVESRSAVAPPPAWSGPSAAPPLGDLLRSERLNGQNSNW